MRLWKLMSNTVGEVSILGPPLGKRERLFVVDAKAMVELMEICDRHLLACGQERQFADIVRQLRDEMPVEESAG